MNNREFKYHNMKKRQTGYNKMSGNELFGGFEIGKLFFDSGFPDKRTGKPYIGLPTHDTDKMMKIFNKPSIFDFLK